MKPDWNREGREWPNREASRFVTAGGLRWHVQVMGEGPALLLLHGSGAATHSWRDLAPRLARDFTVIAPDLPGHGFTDTPASAGLSLPGMSERLSRLLDALEVEPAMAVGHSAGAALALRMALDGRIGNGGVVSLNGALAPFPGSSGRLYPFLAQALFLNPFAIQMFAWRAARPGAVARLIEGTGSRIDARGLQAYERLIQASGHISGVLGMMANWNLQPLVEALPGLPVPLTLVAGENDRAVPPKVSRDVAAAVPGAEFVVLPGLGHLAHEEEPGRAADIVREAWRRSRA